MAGNPQIAAARVDQGSLAAIFEDTPGRIQQPLVQCVQIKSLAAQEGAPKRYRVVFSDIQNYVQTMLATGINTYVTEDRLKKGCFVRLKSYQANAVKGKR
jgi:replication factor A1